MRLNGRELHQGSEFHVGFGVSLQERLLMAQLQLPGISEVMLRSLADNNTIANVSRSDSQIIVEDLLVHLADDSLTPEPRLIDAINAIETLSPVLAQEMEIFKLAELPPLDKAVGLLQGMDGIMASPDILNRPPVMAYSL